MELKVEIWPIDKLIPYARNPRKNDDVLDKMVGAITEFGFRCPIVARSDGLIVDGHLRWAAAKKIGSTHVPVALADELSEAQVKAFRLLANRSSTWAEWDKELLTLEFLDLDGLGFDLNLTGFTEDELDFYTGISAGGDGNTDPDDIPETPIHPVTLPGDVWILGAKHRLVCGDSTDPATVKLALNGVTPLLMVTDPPAGVGYDPMDRGKARNADGKPLSTGGRRAAAGGDADIAHWQKAYELFPGDVAYVWHAVINPAAAQKDLEGAGFDIRMQIIWAKSQFVVSRGHYHMQHESCFYCVKRGRTGNWRGDRKQSTLWQIDKQPKNMSGLSTEKPVECMLRPIENNSSPGQVIFDPFIGSGTTLIAAEMSGRVCIGIEIVPAFTDVCVKRFEAFTLTEAILESTSKTYAEMALERPFGETAATEAAAVEAELAEEEIEIKPRRTRKRA